VALNRAFLIDENFTQPKLKSALKTAPGPGDSVRAFGSEVVAALLFNLKEICVTHTHLSNQLS